MSRLLGGDAVTTNLNLFLGSDNSSVELGFPRPLTRIPPKNGISKKYDSSSYENII